MSDSPLKRSRVPAAWTLAALLGALPFTGCGYPAEGTVKVDPSARHLGTDPVTKQRPDAGKIKPKGDLAPVEPGKLPPGRGRAAL